jgi:hypothetical protein
VTIRKIGRAETLIRVELFQCTCEYRAEFYNFASPKEVLPKAPSSSAYKLYRVIWVIDEVLEVNAIKTVSMTSRPNSTPRAPESQPPTKRGTCGVRGQTYGTGECQVCARTMHRCLKRHMKEYHSEVNLNHRRTHPHLHEE